MNSRRRPVRPWTSDDAPLDAPAVGNSVAHREDGDRVDALAAELREFSLQQREKDLATREHRAKHAEDVIEIKARLAALEAGIVGKPSTESFLRLIPIKLWLWSFTVFGAFLATVSDSWRAVWRAVLGEMPK